MRKVPDRSQQELDGYWRSYDHSFAGKMPHEEKAFSLIERVINRTSRVLEVGVGRGRAVDVLRGRGAEAAFYGLDITDNVRAAECIRVIGDARFLPFRDNSFDAVFSLGVIEHFPETRASIREHARITVRGGYVLVTTPRLSLVTLVRLARYYWRHRAEGTFETVLGRNLKVGRVVGYFREAGLHVLEAGSCGSDSGRTKLTVLLKQVLPRTSWHGFLYCFGQKA